MQATIDKAWAEVETKMERAARRIFIERVRNGVRLYQRSRDLNRLFPGLEELPQVHIIAVLQNALRAAKRSIRKGHWTASPARTLAIRIALAAELGYHRRKDYALPLTK